MGVPEGGDEVESAKALPLEYNVEFAHGVRSVNSIQGGSFVWNPLCNFHLQRDILGKLGAPIPLLSRSQNSKTQPFHSSGVRFKRVIRKTENMLSFLGLLDILSQNLDSSVTFMDFSTPHLDDQKLAKFGSSKGQLTQITLQM